MIIILKKSARDNQVKDLVKDIESLGVQTKIIVGEHSSVIGLVGDTTKVSEDYICSKDIVEAVRRVQEPYKMANRKFHEDDSVIDINGIKIGGNEFQIIAGPCSVESEEQIVQIAKDVKKAGAKLLRGGAFKPRTSPYAFQGLHEEGIKLLLEAKKETGLPIVSELMSINHIDFFSEVDVIQVGARNMQNFEMLKELGKVDKPILLKRGLANTIDEFLMSAEYIMANGNQNVILCERGIRTFETATRNTLDISAVPILKNRSHLPVIVDPSHACGIASLVSPMAKSAVVAGCDGLIIEVHNNPSKALCDGAQSITPESFDVLLNELKPLTSYMKKEL